MKASIRRGDVVYDVAADPRHHGILRSFHLRPDRKWDATVNWIGASCRRVPAADLRRVTSEAPGQPDRVKPGREGHASDLRRAQRIGFGVYDGFATRFNSDNGEIWCLFPGGWSKPSRPTQVLCYDTHVLSEQEYHRMFGWLPPLPVAAFDGDAI